MNKCPQCGWDASKRDEAQDTAKLADLAMEYPLFYEANGGYDYAYLGLHPKKPFGNSGVKTDILECVGWEPEDEDCIYSERQREYADKLFKNLATYIPEKWRLMRVELAKK